MKTFQITPVVAVQGNQERPSGRSAGTVRQITHRGICLFHIPGRMRPAGPPKPAARAALPPGRPTPPRALTCATPSPSPGRHSCATAATAVAGTPSSTPLAGQYGAATPAAPSSARPSTPPVVPFRSRSTLPAGRRAWQRVTSTTTPPLPASSTCAAPPYAAMTTADSTPSAPSA